MSVTENWRILHLQNGDMGNISKYYQILWKRKKKNQENGIGGEVVAYMSETKTGYKNLE